MLTFILIAISLIIIVVALLTYSAARRKGSVGRTHRVASGPSVGRATGRGDD